MYYDGFMQMMGGQIPGMEELVKKLKAMGYHVFGLSNWSEETFSLVRHVYPVLDLMEDMVISGIEKVMKPDHRIFELALDRFGIKASETAFIDDNPNKWHRYMEGIPIVGGRDDIFFAVEKYQVDEIFLAIPSATVQQKREL